ncbi:PIG-L deacetylase family protein [Hymenobacter sp. ASUV-10]|uniref:PIG-L deacetylase family protein n=1 Tax=Hymenobacter aranciens TaxID=3063996 RepID=A0ABT9BFM9_9BACT|nr:PIG-L deacetylase family protein [Hymenobacter sp. ASUV-10]MDO7877065.1 PIG-L deacetylase family protein [Hymenobacter sp. ASUV-10]
MTAFADLPLRSADYAAQFGPTVVVIPHPDDEALGCGGLLALLAQAGQPVHPVLVSDGTMSHPRSRLFSPEARRAVREGELRHSLSLLGVDAHEPLCLRLPDGQVPAEGQPGFTEAVKRLRTFLEETQPATVLAPWRRDPHPDHRASSQLVQAALAQLPAPPHRLEYVVWAWERAAPADLPQPADGVRGFRLDIGAALPQKQRAIRAHRSQLAPGIFTDDANGFLLYPEMLAHFQQPYEVYFEALSDEREPAQ